MIAKELAECGRSRVINMGDSSEREIIRPFCYDLLNVAVEKAPRGGVQATVVGGVNTLAVASLAGTACVIMTGRTVLGEVTAGETKQQEIMVLATEKPIFEAALAIHEMICG